MVKVDSKDTLRMLTTRFMKMNRMRNLIAVIAILLTTLLFTSLFMGAASLALSKRALDIRQFQDSSHAKIQNLSAEDGENVAKVLEENEQVAHFGCSILLGEGTNDEFRFKAQLAYADEYYATSCSSLPTTGTLPQKENEIAVSTIVLDALNLPYELGEKVTLSYVADQNTGEELTDTFRLSGYWKGDVSVSGQVIWVSKDYAQLHYNQDNSGGAYSYVVWYKNLWHLTEKTKQLSQQAGYTDDGTGFVENDAYNLFMEDAFPYETVLFLLFFILLSGYLIIYNVFAISVKTDIRAYGLLKNVGTTGRQLKKIVQMQAIRLSMIGIPAGLILGAGAGYLMAPALNEDMEIMALSIMDTGVVVSANPLIFAAAAVFSLMTVYLSSRRACRMVEKISPVEALHLAENEHTNRKVKKNWSVSPWSMAVQNILQNWKQGLLVMVSLALSLVVVNCIVILVQGYDFNAYSNIYMSSDIQIDQMAGSFWNANFHGVDDTTRELIDACPYSESTGYIYYSNEQHSLDDSIRQLWGESQEAWGDYEKKEWEKVLDTNQIKVHYLGINETVFDKLEWLDEPCSWEEFCTGDYVITDYYGRYDEHSSRYYEQGDPFAMNYSNGKSRKYEVIGNANVPYSLDYPYADIFYITVMVPDTEYSICTGENGAMYAAVDAIDGQEKQARAYMREQVLTENERLHMMTILDMQESFQRYIDKYYVIGGSLAAILALIGTINFFNTMTTSVISRKRELSLLEVVGMTKRQITQMLIWEGMIYISGALLVAILLVSTCSIKLLSNTVGQAFFLSMKVTVLPCIMMLPVLLIIAYIIPKLIYGKMKKESIVERIRIE